MGSNNISGNFLNSGYYVPGTETKNEFCIFTDSKSPITGIRGSNIISENLCVSTILDVNKPLPIYNGINRNVWYYYNALSKFVSSLPHKDFYFSGSSGTAYHYVLNQGSNISRNVYINSGINESYIVQNKSFNYNKFIVLVSKSYEDNSNINGISNTSLSPATSNSLTYYCKHAQTNPVINFVLTTTDIKNCTLKNNYYEVVIHITGSNNWSYSTSNETNQNNTQFSINLPNLEVNDKVEIILQKKTNYAYRINNSNHSVLFIDLEPILFKTATLDLSLSYSDYNPQGINNTVPTYNYGSEDLMNLTCNFTPTNVNNDDLNRYYVKLEIYDSSDVLLTSYYNVVSNNSSIFNIPKNSLLPGTYSAKVSFDPSDSSNNVLNTVTFPSMPGYYTAGVSQTIQFKINKQDLQLLYNTSLLASSYSTLKTASFNDFYLIDLARPSSNNLVTDVSGSYSLTISDSNNNSYTNPSSYSSISPIVTPNILYNLKLLPSNVGLLPDSEYKFKLSFSPNLSSYINSVTSSYYTFNTETPVLKLLPLDIVSPYYTQTVTIQSILVDSSNNKYNNNQLPGTLQYKINTINSTLNSSFNSGIVGYSKTFTPKSLQLLKYTYTNYNITATFTELSNKTINSENSVDFSYNGVKVVSSINKSIANVYDTITVTSTIVDKNGDVVLSTDDLNASIQFKSTANNINTTISSQNNTSDKQFIYTFVPYTDYSIDCSKQNVVIDATLTNISSDYINYSNAQVSFATQLITPTMNITPKTIKNEMYALQLFDVSLNAISGYNDLGTFKLFDTHTNTVVNKSDVPLNVALSIGSEYELTMKKLLGLNNISSANNGDVAQCKIEWKSLVNNIYNTPIESSFNLTLVKTDLSFQNVAFVNNLCTFLETMYIQGNVNSNSLEQVAGTVTVLDSSSNAVIATLAIDNSSNYFNIPLTSDIVNSARVGTFNLKLSFVPTYTKIYNDASIENLLSTFIKATITPSVVLTDYDSDISYNSYTSTYSINFIDNFKIDVSDLSLITGASAKLSLQKGSNVFYNSDKIIDSTGKFVVNSLNMLEIYSSDSLISSCQVLLDVSYNSSLYILNYTTVSINFIKNLNLPDFNQYKIYDIQESLNLSNNKLRYNSGYNIYSTFNLSRSSSNNLLPITGSLQLQISGLENLIDLSNNFTISTNGEILIQNNFIPSDYDMNVGYYSIKYIFTPNNNNLTIMKKSINITILPDTINSVDLALIPFEGKTNVIYGEQFNGILSFNIPRNVTGSMELWCTNPNKNAGGDQLLTSRYISSNNEDVTKDYTINDLLCDAIIYDCAKDTTTYEIYVKFVSTNENYKNNEFYRGQSNQKFSVTVETIPVHISELRIDNIKYTVNSENKVVKTVYESGLEVSSKVLTDNEKQLEIFRSRYTNDVMVFSGKLMTADGNYVTSGNINLSSLNTTIPINNNNNYTPVDANGYFEFTLTFSSDLLSTLFLNDPNCFNIIYTNDINFTERMFDYYDDNNNIISGFYGVSVVNPFADISLQLVDSTLTGNNSYYYQEDLLEFRVTINNSYELIKNGSVYIQLFDSANNQIGDVDGYSTNQINEDGVAIVKINPKTIGLNVSQVDDHYKAFATFVCNNEFAPTLSEQDIQFTVIKTTPVISLDVYDIYGNPTNNVDYLSNVNITVKVKTQQDLANHNSFQTRNINGTVLLKKKTVNEFSNTSYYEMVITSNTSDIEIINDGKYISFDNKNSYNNGASINYSPFENAPTIILNQDGIVPVFNNLELDSVNYENYVLEKPITHFKINLHSVNIVVKSILTLASNDVQHILDSNTNVDDLNIYYGNNTILFNGAINFDEKFEVITSFDKNIPGTLTYEYSTTGENNSYSALVPNYPPIVTNPTFNSSSIDITAVFDPQLISVTPNNTYWLKVIFTPNNENYYKKVNDVKGFNLYEANNFGYGTIYFNNENISKTLLYDDSKSFQVDAKINFNSIVPMSDRRCLVELYYDNYEPSNKLSNDIIYLTNDSNSYTFTFNNTRLPFRDTSYALKALFIPVYSNGDYSNGERNLDFPVKIQEITALTLNVNPYLSITSPYDDFTYHYSDNISADIVVHSGASNVNPYSKFVINTSNSNTGFSYTSYFDFSTSSLDQTIHIEDLNQYLANNTSESNNSLVPGKYSFTIYATTNEDIVEDRTNTIKYNFTVTKKPITLSVALNTHFLLYRDSLDLSFNIGANFPINNGSVNLTFTDNITSNIITKEIKYFNLTNVNGYDYLYTITDLSSLLYVGSFSVYADISNSNFLGSYLDTTALIVNKTTNCSIVLNHPNNVYKVDYLESIPVKANILYNGSEKIQDASVSYIVNNGSSQPADILSGQYSYSFDINSEFLNKGVNEVVVYFTHSNYSGLPSIFQINVGKEVVVSSDFILEYVDNSLTSGTFRLRLDNVQSDDTVTFYKKSSIVPITPNMVDNNYYTFNYSDINYESNLIYAVIRSTNYDVTSTSVSIYRDRKDANIVLLSDLNSNYKSGLSVNLIYEVKESLYPSVLVTEGNIEIHKVTVSESDSLSNEIIVSIPLGNNGRVELSNYELISTESGNCDIQFYAVFKNSPNFNISESERSRVINIYQQYPSVLSDNTNWNSSYKFGDTVNLQYTISKSLENRNILNGDELVEAEKLNLLNIASENLLIAMNNKENAEDALNVAFKNKTNAKRNSDDAKEISDYANQDLLDASSNLADALTKYNLSVTDLSSSIIDLNSSIYATELVNTIVDLSNAIITDVSANLEKATAKTNYDNAVIAANDAAQDVLDASNNKHTAENVVIDASTNKYNADQNVFDTKDILEEKNTNLFNANKAVQDSSGSFNTFQQHFTDASVNFNVALTAFNDASNNLTTLKK